MIRRGLFGGLALAALAGCGALGLDVSDRQYEALEEQAARTTDYAGEPAVCDFVERSIAAGGMAPPLAYPKDVLERYEIEHC